MPRHVRALWLAVCTAILLSTLIGPAFAAESTLAQADIDTGLTGTLRDGEGEPVPDVAITVTDADGNEVGSAVTDAQGVWSIQINEAGTYTVTLVEETLPEGVTLRDPDRNPLEVDVIPGRVRPALFALGEGAATRGQTAALFRALANGLKFGLIIAMTAVGLSLIFGTTGLINFAHGELVASGALLAWYLNVQSVRWHLLLAGAVAVAAIAAFGGALERGLFRPLRRRRVGLFQLLIVSIGLSILVRFILLLFFGGSLRTYRNYVGQQAVQMGPVSLTPRDMIIMALSVLILVAVGLMLQGTRIGKAMRAVADNRDLAESSGIDVNRVILVVWILGAGLAALGGILFGSAVAADYFMGFRLLLLMFAGVILGGLGTAYGAMVGSLVIGLVTELSVLWFPAELKFMWALIVLIIVLLIRPQGILGHRERVG